MFITDPESYLDPRFQIVISINLMTIMSERKVEKLKRFKLLGFYYLLLNFDKESELTATLRSFVPREIDYF